MFIEFYNEKQAMDVLNYATEKDYDFETGDAAWEISYIQDIKEELDPHKLYDTTIYQYKYKEGYLSSEKGKRKDRIGFIVEDLEKQYPIAVDYIKDEKGKEIPENWNDRYLIPPMLKLIQEQKQEIDTLKQQLATLTERMDRYEQGLQ